MDEYSWLFVFLGGMGALLTSTSWVPQIIKGYQMRSLKGVSALTLSIFGMGTLCWLAYGIFRVDWLIIAANAFISCCILTLIIMKILYRDN